MFGGVHQRRHRAGKKQDVDPWVLAMGMQLLSQISQLERKPPVTLALMAVNVAAWLGMLPLAELGGGWEPMLCPAAIVAGIRPYTHLLLSAFVHASDGGYHLVYNMASLLWKGVTLELEMGSERFAAMVAALLLLSHGMYVPLSYLATSLFGAATFHGCAVGFSAVLFGLKVVINHSQVGQQAVSFWGIPFPVHAKYAAWVELVLISLVAPDASFVGHLCGILAGIIWLHASGLAKACLSSGGRPAVGRPQQPFRHWGSGTLGAGRPSTAARPTASGAAGTSWGRDEEAELREALRRSRMDF